MANRSRVMISGNNDTPILLWDNGDGTYSLATVATNGSGAANTTLPAGANRSGTAGTTSSQLAAANTARKGLNIQNISANQLGINEFGGAAAIGSPGTYTLSAGSSVNIRTNQQINVIASAASSAYTATEF